MPIPSPEGSHPRVFSEVFKSLLPKAEVNHLTLLFESHPDLPPLHGDCGQLDQVVTNLLSNALSYTHAPGQVIIRTGIDPIHQKVILEVEDTGSGIHPEDLPHLFERFYRGKSSRGARTGGSGLGLSIVNEIVALHSGEINVESAVGQGSRFTLKFPSARR